MRASKRWWLLVAVMPVGMAGCTPSKGVPSGASQPSGASRLTYLEAQSGNGKATWQELVELGETYLGQGETLKAAKVGFSARDAAPKVAGPHNLLGMVYGELVSAYATVKDARGMENSLVKARVSFHTAIDAEPENRVPRLNLARLEIRQKEAERAVQVLEEALVRWPKDAEIWTLVGQAQRLRHANVGAAASFRKAIEYDPKLAEAHFSLGLLHTDFDRPSEALPEFEKAYELGDRDPVTLSYLALALLSTEKGPADRERAGKLLEEAGQPTIPPALFAEGLLLQRSGKPTEARKRFEQILAQEPDHQRSQYQLAMALREEGKLPASADALRKYHQMVIRRQTLYSLQDRLMNEPKNPQLRRDLGRVLLTAGRAAEAEVQFQEWRRLQPKNPEPSQWIQRARKQAAQAAAPPSPRGTSGPSSVRQRAAASGAGA